MTLSLLGLGHLLPDVSQKFGNYEKSWDVERLQYSVKTGHGPPPPAEPSPDINEKFLTCQVLTCQLLTKLSRLLTKLSRLLTKMSRLLTKF